MSIVPIANRRIGAGEPALIVAELGVNHNGDPEVAARMVDAAAAAGADAVKFQVFTAEEFVNDPTEIYEYKSQGRVVRESTLEMFRRLELADDDVARLFARARGRGLMPFATVTDGHAADLLERLETPAFKIGSDDLVYTSFLRRIAQRGRPVVISTGMADTADIDRAVRVIEQTGNDKLIILHCVSLYPTPDDAVNLRRITALADRYDHPVGFSDHTLGATAALGAVTLGACMIEKHFTLDHAMDGPDHWFSADPAELAMLVSEVRRLEGGLEPSGEALSGAERQMAKLCHRSIVAVASLPAGAVLREEHLGFKRPGTGIMPYELDNVLGRRLRRPVTPGTQIRWEMLDDAAV
jgi:N,N'-diacetyllegionaminate synthase